MWLEISVCSRRLSRFLERACDEAESGDKDIRERVLVLHFLLCSLSYLSRLCLVYNISNKLVKVQFDNNENERQGQ